MLYKLFAGMTGGFNDVICRGCEEFNTREEAESAAYELAVEQYLSYEGFCGVKTYEDCCEDYFKENGRLPTGFDPNYTKKLDKLIENMNADELQEVTDAYYEEISSWIEYYVEPQEG